jgi:hypothetical protein
LTIDEKKCLINEKKFENWQEYAIGTALETINQIVTNQIHNGVVFMNTDTSIQTKLIAASLAMNNLKRVVVLNWEPNQDSRWQKCFSHSEK